MNLHSGRLQAGYSIERGHDHHRDPIGLNLRVVESLDLEQMLVESN